MGKLKLLKEIIKMDKDVSSNPELKIKMEEWIENKYGTIKWKNLNVIDIKKTLEHYKDCLLYTSPSPRDRTRSRMPSSA